MAYEPYSSSSAAAENGSSRQLYLQRWEGLKQERLSWIPHWQELSEFILPRNSRFLSSDKTRAGVRKDDSIINATPTYSSRVLAAGMMAGITSPARPWFRLTTPDPELAEFGAVKLWLSEVEERIRQALARSNIYKSLSKMYVDLGTFGVSPIIVEEDSEDILRSYVLPLGSYALANNHKAQVDTLFHETGMTVRQLVQRFGLKRCSRQVQNLWKNNMRRETWIDVLHIVEARDPGDRDAQQYDGRNMAWKSCWLELRADTRDGLLSESGYEEFPVMAPRWETTGEDVYGSCPGMTALGDSKQLQLMEKRKLMLIDKSANPPMQAPASMRTERISLMPGDTTYVNAVNPGQVFQPAYLVNPAALPAIREEIRAVEQRIRQAYYADLWLMFAEADGGQPITAREVAERHEEKMLQLGPVMENLEDELLDPLVDRVFSVIMRNGFIPPPPPELSGTELRIEYISMMAQAQKLLGTANVERLLGTAGNIAGVEPSVLDNIDLDETFRTYGDMLGVPPKILRTAEQIARIRAAKAKQAQQQAQMQQAANVVQGAQVLSQTDMEGDNALTRMVQNMGGATAAQAS